MPAALRKYWATHRRKSNPHRRRKAHTSHRRHRNPAPRHYRVHHRRRRNPDFLGAGRGMMGQAKQAFGVGLVGGLAGIANDLLYGYTSGMLPAAVTAAPFSYLVRALGAVLVGVAGGKVMPGKGQTIMNGAMTVVLYSAIKENLITIVPQLPLGLSGLGAFVSSSPIVGVGVPRAPTGVPLIGNGIPSARGMGKYFPRTGMGGVSGVGGYDQTYADGTDWT
jgi:hypothetical protein